MRQRKESSEMRKPEMRREKREVRREERRGERGREDGREECRDGRRDEGRAFLSGYSIVIQFILKSY